MVLLFLMAYVCLSTAKSLNLEIKPASNTTYLASASAIKSGECYLTLDYKNVFYPQFMLTILPSLCTDIILGHDFLSHHSSLEISFPGTMPGLKICNLAVANVPPPPIFNNLKPDCTPIAVNLDGTALVNANLYERKFLSYLRTILSNLAALLGEPKF